MLYNTLHNRWLRLIAAVVGELISALALNLFIVPLNLYTGGTMGVCQLVRTLLQTYGGLDFGPYDVAGILYFITNIPHPDLCLQEPGTGTGDPHGDLHGCLLVLFTVSSPRLPLPSSMTI